METKHKGDYASPTITVVEIQMQQVLCQSTTKGNINSLSGTLNGYTGEEQVWF